MPDRTTISTYSETKQRFDRLKPDGMSADSFMAVLLDGFEAEAEANADDRGDATTPTEPSKSDVDAVLARLDDIETQLNAAPERLASELRKNRF